MTACSDRGLTEVVETYEYPTTGLHSFILILFEKYSNLLEKQFGKRFKDVSRQPVGELSADIRFRSWNEMTASPCKPRTSKSVMR